MLAGSIFIHIPRTGGLGICRAHACERVWHSAGAAPKTSSCNIATALRNETERYCSEWNFYGVNFFSKNRTVKGWMPQRRPATFQQFYNDASTHNSMVRILSGCQLYDAGCVVTEDTVRSILARVATGCLRVVPPLPRVVHANPHTCSARELEAAYRANPLDRLLLRNVERMHALGA